MAKSIALAVTVLMLTGCASQQWAQAHWDQIKGTGNAAAGYRTGVSINTYTVNGTSYQVVAPVGR